MKTRRTNNSLCALNRRIIACRRCPRLVAWREETARTRVRRYAAETYWARPVPGFGDPRARLLLVGLAPAAHGGNRTGRVFTGDRSGDWLFRALFRAGFANQPTSVHKNDGLKLTDCYITASVRCAPPDNKPLPEEFARCQGYLLRELSLLSNVRVVVGLGKIGFDAALQAYKELGRISYKARPRFAHGAEASFEGLTFIACFHPSQQNTFTGRLTEGMMEEVFGRVRELVESSKTAEVAKTAQ